MFLEVFEYNIKFDKARMGDREFTKYIAADSVEEAQTGIEMIIRKLFANGLVDSQNLREIIAEPKSDADYEKATFGKFGYDINQVKEKFKDFFR